MASSIAEICNLALSNIRSDRFIESLDDSSTEAIVCKVHYANVRDQCLRRADWPFARKRVALVQTGTPPPEWAYSYAYPSDCIAVRGIADGQLTRTIDTRIPFAIENDGSGSNRVILMNEYGATMIYTMRAQDPVIYPPEFSEVLSWKLAAAICRPLDKSEIAVEVYREAERMMGAAAAISYNEQKAPPPAQSEHFTARTNG